MKNLPLEQNFFPQTIQNQVMNEFEKMDRNCPKSYKKRLSHQKGSLSCLIELFRPDQVQKMIESPSKTTQGKNYSSQLINRSSTHLIDNKSPENDEKTKNILLKVEKIQYSLADLQKRIKISQNKKIGEGLTKIASQLNLIPFNNFGSKIYPINSAQTNKIKSIKEKLQKIRLKGRPISCKNISQKPFIPKTRDSPSKTYQIKNDQNPSLGHFSNLQNSKKLLFGLQKLTIQDFQEYCHLGRGVYGAVSLYRHIHTNFLTAIKIIPKAKLNSEDHTYLTREIKLQTFSYHPNIAQIYTFFDDAESIYLVLEFCNEGNLYDLVQKQGGKMKEEKVKRHMRNICKAVGLLHANNIIHRDLKPQNILVSNGVAKLCDFGWAVRTPDMRDTLCGTPLYSSPELIKNEHYDRKIDIWSIGVMTYEFIYGKGPFGIKSRDDLYKVVEREVEFSRQVKTSKQCKDFIKGCLQKQASDRPEIWQLLAHAFMKEEEKIRDSIKVSVVQNINAEDS